MSSLTGEALTPLDVPESTENGRFSQETVRRIREASIFLPFSLAAVSFLWCAYLFAASLLWARYSSFAVLLVPTVGAYLFSWLGFYRHELWHRYFPKINNAAWYDFVSSLLFSDPQVFRAAHASHHKFVHTPDDLEFFCQDWVTDRGRRKRQFILELLFGNVAWELSLFRRLRKRGQATWRARLVAFARQVAISASLLVLVVWTHPGAGRFFFATCMLTVWSGAVMTRHVQWIEHLNIVSDGPLAERNLLTRNLCSDTVWGRLFNVLSHHDAREHVYHHTEPRLNGRGLAGLQLPPDARTIALSEYPRILWGYYRNL
ncbi:MAG TPA: fatty acid desaturase [Candidatus Binatia bacterium]|jgi:hypothetical protein|nr:fatty acid desaturase [Candidatus Binatia bacterium]